MAERTISWGPRNSHTLIGKETTRLDGLDKASGFAKYTADMNQEGTLYCRILTSKHGKAKITRLNVDAAKKIAGVHTIYLFKNEGDDCNWDGDTVAAVAAETADIAEDGVRAIEVTFEELPHFVDEEDLEAARKVVVKVEDDDGKLVDGSIVKEGIVDRTVGDPDKAIEEADVVHTGYYGIHTISHQCLEPHGAHCTWNDGDEGPKLTARHSTQAVSTTGKQFASKFGLDATGVRVICNFIGGGFGSKFAADEWGLAAAQMSKDTGRPVRLMLDRATEMKTPGTRPSGFAKITVAAKKDGKITAWKSHHWGTSGPQGKTIDGNQLPYVFEFDNKHVEATGIMTNCGPNRAWRAPNHPQLCAITDTVMTDLAAKLKMDPLDLFKVNLGQLDKVAKENGDLYRAEIDRAAELMDWKKKFHPHGEGGSGSVKRGIGLALHRWGGQSVKCEAEVRLFEDGGAQVSIGSQDLGTGTRTVIAVVLAETCGLPIEKVTARIGTSEYVYGNPSGGSITVGSVSGGTRRAALAAIWKLFDKVAAKYDVDGESLAARDEAIWSGDKKVCSWKDACRLIGTVPITEVGLSPLNDGLTSKLVGGVQMADVSVDTETGIVRINKMVAVQDCGTIINEMTAKSQVYGGLIMGIAYALSEERIMDNKTGRYINADMENYRLPRIGDIGELEVEMYQPDSEYNRGVVGLGEPPVISTGACIANAVANATGVRVPVLPMTPKRVLEALKGGQA
jgi:xanthine dehydrogenase YagR molybdenum-binding subunit